MIGFSETVPYARAPVVVAIPAQRSLANFRWALSVGALSELESPLLMTSYGRVWTTQDGSRPREKCPSLLHFGQLGRLGRCFFYFGKGEMLHGSAVGAARMLGELPARGGQHWTMWRMIMPDRARDSAGWSRIRLLGLHCAYIRHRRQRGRLPNLLI